MDVIVERFQRRKIVSNPASPMLYYLRQKPKTCGTVDIDVLAAAEDMDLPVGLAGAVPDRLKGQAVFEREALIDAAHDFANRLRDILPRFFTEFPHPARQVALRDEFWRVRINEALERLCRKR